MEDCGDDAWCPICGNYGCGGWCTDAIAVAPSGSIPVNEDEFMRRLSSPRIAELCGIKGGPDAAGRLQLGDPVNSPTHYAASAVETIDAIDAWGLGFCLGNTVKYISRAGKKDPDKIIEDLEKARWYLNHEIDRLKKERGDA